MRKLMSVLVVVVLASIAMAGTAAAQDTVEGDVTADPATVPEAGEYTFSATGSGFIPDTSVLLVKCTLPGDTVTSVEEARAASENLDPLADCDLASAQNVDVDSDGNWAAELTAEVGDNFLLSAGTLDNSQAGGAWVPIVPEGATDDAEADTTAEAETTEEEDLAETGVETGLLAIIGVAVVGAGALIVREGRRLRD